MNRRNVLRAGTVLALFAVAGAGLVALSHRATAGRIEDNRRAVLLRSLNTLLPATRYDNDLLHDTSEVRDPALLGTEQAVTVYRARSGGRPYAAAFMPVAPDGYSGAIKLLVGIEYDGTLAGVRVIEHHETPGLGDAIDAARSDWILGFSGRRLDNPPAAQWLVKRDGGIFDQFTGATVTPRAVVKAVHNSLEFFSAHREELFSQTAR